LIEAYVEYRNVCGVPEKRKGIITLVKGRVGEGTWFATAIA